MAQEIFFKLLINSECRGIDATGITYFTLFNKRNFLIPVKEDKPASEFLKTPQVKDFLKAKSPLAIGHTRQATSGTPDNPLNNHPFTRSGLSMVHNGIIFPYILLCQSEGVTLHGVCDSEAIIAITEKYFLKSHNLRKAILKTASILEGSMTCLFLNVREPNTIYALVSQHPLALALHQPTQTLFIGSTPEILKASIFKEDIIWGLLAKATDTTDWLIYEAPDDTLLKITPHKIVTYPVKRPEVKKYSWTTRYDFANDDTKKEINGQTNLLENKASFDPTEPIKKPSKYLSTQLEKRLDKILQEADQLYLGNTSGAKITQLDVEYRRIIEMLKTRKYLTPPEALTRLKAWTSEFEAVGE